MIFITSIILGSLAGYSIKATINWLAIEDFKIDKKNFILEFLTFLGFFWSFTNLTFNEAVIFSGIYTILLGIAFVDLNTFQIPLVFIIVGVVLSIAGVLINNVILESALWGVFVGAIIPLVIMAVLWVITKRQGMGFGDIQLGIVLGAWLGPMRMALTLFSASVLSLLAWIAVSLIEDFDKNRAMPMAPFLAVAGIGVYVGSFYYPEFFHLLIIQ